MSDPRIEQRRGIRPLFLCRSSLKGSSAGGGGRPWNESNEIAPPNAVRYSQRRINLQTERVRFLLERNLGDTAVTHPALVTAAGNDRTSDRRRFGGGDGGTVVQVLEHQVVDQVAVRCFDLG